MYSVRDGGVIVRKRAVVAGRENRVLYCVAGDGTGGLVFGVREAGGQGEFYAEN